MPERNWIIEETQHVSFGDKRLNRRYGEILNSFETSPDKSIPQSSKSWAETIAAYRFFNHERVTGEKILNPHQESTKTRIKEEKIVLIPQDTTEMNFTGRKEIEGMGYLDHDKSQGFYLHLSLAVTPERNCLGVVEAEYKVRKELGSRRLRNQKKIEEKETYCWVRGYEAANKMAVSAPNTRVISIADREGDIYEFLEKMPSALNKAYWLVRSRHNR